MGLERRQRLLSLGTLYQTGIMEDDIVIGEQRYPNLFINSGTVDVYGSNSATQPTSLSSMVLNDENTGVSGIVKFEIVPKWIAIVQNTGTTTELVSYGINASAMGAIS